MANLIVYGTGFTKHTRAISEYLAKKIFADVYNVKKIPVIDFGKYDTVIFGTNVHAGHPNKNVQEYFTKHKNDLEGKRVILFMSCMYDGEKGQKQAEGIATIFGSKEYMFFSSKGEKDLQGIPLKVNDFIKKYFESIQTNE